jgi:hypothetical protein
MATTKVSISGPVFDARAAAAVRQFGRALAVEVAEIGQTWIQLDTERMDKSGRGGTGAAAGGVSIAGDGDGMIIFGGIRKGEYSWPWLEGTSQRNQSTGFRGYHTFRRTRLRMRRQVTPFARAQMAALIEKLGGGA